MCRTTRCAPEARRPAPPTAPPGTPPTPVRAPARPAPSPLARMLAVGPVHRCADGGCAHAGLPVSRPEDPQERDADRIADRVMRSVDTPAPSGAAAGAGTAWRSGGTAAPAVARSGWGGGRALDTASRARFEPRLGARLDHVRVHTGADAATAARQVSAAAFTVGADIVFAAGRYAPESRAGQRLLAHELAHVVHHSGPPTVRRQVPIPIPVEPPMLPPEIVLPRGVGPMPEIGPVPEIGPFPEIGPVPEIGPAPTPTPTPTPGPMPGPVPGPFPVPPVPPLIGPVPGAEPAPTIGDDPGIAPEPDVGPAPEPHVDPEPDKDKKKEPDCADPKWLTHVTWATGAQGQAGTVTAEPLTRCPGNTRASMADERVYQAQFDCIRRAGQRRTFHPLHVLHGLTRRTGPRNLHGPGNVAWNIIIGSASLNGLVYHGAEWDAIARIHGLGQALWYEAKVSRYVPGNEFFASTITVDYGLFDIDARTRGPRIGGGTFDETRTAPVCPPSAPVTGVPAVVTPPAADFTSTLTICGGGLESRRFAVTGGGVSVSIRADWVPPSASAPCPAAGYSITLWKDNPYWPDGDFGTQALPTGRPVTVSWRYLVPGDYYIKITPNLPAFLMRQCCLDGDIAVRTFAAPRPTPGVPEIA